MYGLCRPASRTTRKALSHHHHHRQIVVKGIWTKVSDKARKKVYFADSTRVKKLTPTTRQPPTLHSDRILLDALPVLYTNDSKAAAAWVNRNIPEDEPCVIGFDVESAPSKQPWIRSEPKFKGAAVVQLATPVEALVIHLTKPSGAFSQQCAPLIKSILSNPQIVKAGCGIVDDGLELREKWDTLEIRSRFDLGGLGGNLSNQMGLRTLCTRLLHVDLPKTKKVAVSDWSSVPLSKHQLAYAARDAWAAAAIAAELEAIAPETFSPSALIERLKSQRSLEMIIQRKEALRQAKKTMKSLHGPYSDLYKDKRRQVDELRQILEQNRYDDLDIFDPVELGLDALKNITAK